MATNHTTNYELNQWLSTDQVLRTDFNADNVKLDTALNSLSGEVAQKADQSALNAVAASVQAKADQTALDTLNSTVQQLTADLTKIVVGSYTGNGVSPRTISLGAKPKAVLVVEAGGRLYYYLMVSQFLGGLAVDGHDALAAGLKGPAVGTALNALLDRVAQGELENDRETLLRELARFQEGM